MSIKDKVINILFDDEEVENTSSNNIRRSDVKKEDKSSIFVDTTPIFIDANPTKKQSKQEDPIKEIVKEIKLDDGYRMTENISPIFGLQRTDTKTKRTNQKAKTDINVKMYDGLVNAGASSNSNSYSSVIISPIFGPIENKPTRKNPTRAKKQADPFKRSIDDTGEFKTSYIEKSDDDNEDAINFEQEAPVFEDVKEEKVALEKLGDTDRISKISDRINQIKNEAAHIYSHDPLEHIETRKENKIENHSTISDLIHSFQKQDEGIDFSVLKRSQEEAVSENIVPEYIEEEKEEVVEDIPLDEIIKEEISEEPIEEVKPQIEEPVIEVKPIEPKAPLFEEHNEQEDTQEHRIEDSTQLTLEDTFNQITEKLDESSSQSSIDDIFEDDGDDGKDLFSDLFGDE